MAHQLQQGGTSSVQPTTTTTTTGVSSEQVSQAPHTVEKIPSSAQETVGSPSIPLMPKRMLGMLTEAVTGGKKEGETPAKKQN